jgi:hypothetical protein
MKSSIIGISFVLQLLLGSCVGESRNAAEVVVVSMRDLDRSTGTLVVEFANTTDDLDVCFPHGKLLEGERASGLRVFTQTGEEISLINQGHAVPGSSDAMLGAGRRRVVRVPLRANLEGEIPMHGCLTFRALYARCGMLGAPMSELLHRGLSNRGVEILEGAWSIDGSAVTADAACERFFDGRIG